MRPTFYATLQSPGPRRIQFQLKEARFLLQILMDGFFLFWGSLERVGVGLIGFIRRSAREFLEATFRRGRSLGRRFFLRSERVCDGGECDKLEVEKS